METLFNISYTGEIVEGFEKETVKQNLMKLFGLKEEQVEKVLAKPGTILKKQIDDKTRRKYESILSEAGIKIESVAISSASEKQAPRAEVPKEKQETAPTEYREENNVWFEFTGKGKEYFSIWLVNVLLSVVTLGIYSAWAKVRRKQYFYRNTKLNGTAFQYDADPVAILKGRSIVAVFFVCYLIFHQVFRPVAIVLGIIFLILLPWLLIRSITFRAQSSSYRGIRFSFKATYFEAVKALLFWPAIGVITLGIMAPFAYFNMVRFLVKHSRFGSTHFEFESNLIEYYWLILKAVLFILVGLGLAMISTMMFHQVDFESGSIYSTANLSGLIPMFFCCLFVFAYLSVNRLKLLFDSTTLSTHKLCTSLEIWEFTRVFAVNTVLTALTLGLFIPWAVVRSLEYKLAHLGVEAASGIDGFVTAEEKRSSALQEEKRGFFDIDLGL